MHTMADRRMARLTPLLTLPLIAVAQHAARRDVLRDQGGTGGGVRRVADSPALLPCLARDHTDDRGTSIGIGAMTFEFIGAQLRRIGGSSMQGAFFPPRCGPVRRRRRRHPPAPLSGPWR